MSQPGSQLRGPTKIAGIAIAGGLLVGLAYFLWMEHRAHTWAALPWVLFLLLHLFMHRHHGHGHGHAHAHEDHEPQQQQSAPSNDAEDA